MYNTIIVEDDPMVRDLNRKYIENHDSMNVCGTFENGLQALEFLESGPSIDLIILDVYMPNMNGEEFLRELRRREYDCSVIMVTAANNPEFFNRISCYGITDYLVKPFELSRMQRALDRFLKIREITSGGNKISQKDLDAFYATSGFHADTCLEKGLQLHTLERIENLLKKSSNISVSVDTIAGEVGLSKVTVRKYLNYLVEVGLVKSDIDYSTGGRPSFNYRYLEK